MSKTKSPWFLLQRVCTLSLVLAAAAGLWSASCSTAAADNFKMENSVYASDQPGAEPTSRSITYFTADAVYDWMKEPAEVTIFEKTANRLVLVDAANSVRTELSTKDIMTFVERLRQLAAKNADPLVKFAAEPAFRESFDEAKSELTLSSQLLTYRLALVTEGNKDAVEQYHEFCDWHARLNAMLSPGSLPPFGRLAVNAAMAQRQAIPSHVFLTIASAKPGLPPTNLRTEHRILRPLSDKDMERINLLQTAAKNCKLVTFEQYRKAKPEK